MHPSPSLLLALVSSLFLLNSCSVIAPGVAPSAAYPSYDPTQGKSVPLRHYPVGRQGNLTAWLTSDHRMSSGDYLYNPKDPSIRHRIVGRIRASSMKEAVNHDGAFLLTNDYNGPIYPLWEGAEGKGLLYGGETIGWIPVDLYHKPGVNIWVASGRAQKIGFWSGFPVVVGDPANPEAIAGAMWYRTNKNHHLGGATSPRMLKSWLGRLDFKDYVK